MPPKSRTSRTAHRAVPGKTPGKTAASALLAQGVALHQGGQPAQAQALYEQVLKLQPRHFDALHLSGVAAWQMKQPERGLALIGQAIAVNPGIAAAHNNLGNVLKDLRQFEAAVQSYDRAVALKPDYAEAYNNRGVILRDLRQFEAALESYDRAIALKPDYAEAHNIRGVVLCELKRLEEALRSYDRAIELKPDYAEAHSNRGILLRRLKQPQAALASYDRAIALRPDYAEAWNNRGNVLRDLKQYEAAVASYDRAIALRPNFAEAHNNHGSALQDLGRLQEALASYDRALALRPAYAEACCNRGVVLQALNQFEASVASYDRALALEPGYADAHFSRGLALLTLGDFKRGWEEYEWRWKNEKLDLRNDSRAFPQPWWRGEESLAGKTILLYGEQGLGDTLQFCRYATRVKELGARVILEVQPALLDLMATLDGPAQVVGKGGELPAFDYQCPLLSLPLAFKTDLASIPSAASYLKASPGKLAQWNIKLGEKRRPRVGIVWSGNAEHRNDRNRSLPLPEVVTLLSADYELVSLQKDLREDDRGILQAHPELRHFGRELKDFTDTAALCELMDVVISVDTSVVHLAGALGKPVWVLLPFIPDWRWLLQREDSPWYPTARLYRQPQIGDWGSVMARVKTGLAQTYKAAVSVAPEKTAAEANRLFGQGLALHQQGRLAQARALYEQILHSHPAHFDSLHLSGVIAWQMKQYERALELIDRALEINPGVAEAHNNRGNVLKDLRRPEEAVHSYERAIALKPDYADAYSNRGVMLRALQRLDEAVQSYERAIALRPDAADAHNNLGVVLQELGQWQAAAQSYDRALALRPAYAEAWNNRGNVLRELQQRQAALESYERAIALKPDYAEACSNRGIVLHELKQFEAALASYDRAIAIHPAGATAHSNRGGTLQALKQFEAALASYERAIEINPDYAEAHNNRGTALQELKQWDAALASYQRAVALKPDYAEAHSNLGIVLKDLNRLDEALDHCERAVVLKPGFADAHHAHGVILQKRGQLEDALVSYERAIALRPDFAEAQLSLSLALLSLGRFGPGWEKYEWRWKSEKLDLYNDRRYFSRPLWLGGEPLQGKTIFLYAEQGLGDTLQFCRYAKHVRELGARVILEVQPPLLDLMATLDGPAQVLGKGGELPAFDYQCPLLSLPLALKTDLASIPSAASYLKASLGKLAQWHAKLGEKHRPRVGIVWSGNAQHKNDRNRSLGLNEMAGLLSADYDCFSLQKEVRDADRQILDAHPDLRHFGEALEDFSDTAALCELMDVVISVDTSVAHLAGALGKPVWILLPFSADWRWLQHRGDSPWYPTARLYRQQNTGDWDGVIARVKADLATLCATQQQ